MPFTMSKRTLGWLVALVGALVTLLSTPPARAVTPHEEVALGLAAQSAQPPDLEAARQHFARAAASDDDRSAADGLYLLGDVDDAELRFADALVHYDASAARLPSGRYTPRAKNRASELRTHAEGDFVPLAKLETVRRSAGLSNDAAAIDGLVVDAAAFPPGRVRVEARMLAAEAYLGRLHRRDDALPLLRLVVADPAAELLTARAAASELVRAYTERKQYADALAVVRAYPKLLEPNAERALVRLIRRRPLRWIAIADLVLVVASALVALARPGRASIVRAVLASAPLAVCFAALASGGGGFLASRYEQSSPYPFSAMFPAILGVALLARAWSAAGSRSTAARTLRATVAFAGVFAAAFLVLDRMDPIYLQGFGL